MKQFEINKDLKSLADWMSDETMDTLGISHIEGTRRYGIWYVTLHVQGRIGSGAGVECSHAMTAALLEALSNREIN